MARNGHPLIKGDPTIDDLRKQKFLNLHPRRLQANEVPQAIWQFFELGVHTALHVCRSRCRVCGATFLNASQQGSRYSSRRSRRNPIAFTCRFCGSRRPMRYSGRLVDPGVAQLGHHKIAQPAVCGVVAARLMPDRVNRQRGQFERNC